jgi:thiamine biosynthesis lipoprotein
MNRRDFLNPRQVAHLAGQVVGAFREPVLTSPQDDVDYLRVSRRAMATTFEIVLAYGTLFALAVAETAFNVIDRLEGQLTVYRDDSEVSRLNRLASLTDVPVEENLFELLHLADRITHETDGAFDITAGALIKAWGFFRRCHRVPSTSEIGEVLTRTGMCHVRLDAEQHSVRYLLPGLEINLGSIGKGYALDRAARLLRDEWSLPAALLHGGQSSVYALGAAPGSERGWPVGIQHPWDPEKRLAMVWLCDRALGTSAATYQHLEYNGRKLGHILDPRTGWPAEGMASVSVVARTAAEADALATAFFILGWEKAQTYCAAHPEVGAVLLPEGDSAQPLVFGLSAHECQLLPSAHETDL